MPNQHCPNNRCKIVSLFVSSLSILIVFSVFLTSPQLSTADSLKVDPTFKVTAGARLGNNPSPVTGILELINGDFLIYGVFDRYNNFGGLSGILRVNPKGRPIKSFKPKGQVRNESTYGIEAVAQRADGKIFIAGYFDTINGSDHNLIALLNDDGSIDESFASTLVSNTDGTGGHVTAIFPLSDGGAVISAGVQEINGAPNHAVFQKLRADGSIDTSFSENLMSQFLAGTFKPLRVLANDITLAQAVLRSDSDEHFRLVKVDSNGIVVNDLIFDDSIRFATNEVDPVVSAIPDPVGGFLVTGIFGDKRSSTFYRTFRITDNGSLDSSFVFIENPTRLEAAITPQGARYISGNRGSKLFTFSIDQSGNKDPKFKIKLPKSTKSARLLSADSSGKLLYFTSSKAGNQPQVLAVQRFR